jgi:transposase
MAPNHDIATRALVVTLKSVAGKSNSEVCYLTGLPESTVRSIYAKAIKRGFEYNASQPVTICNAHLEDAPRSGRPAKETEAVRQSITQKLVRDRYGREKSCADLAGELS